jgi:1-acyl-sn-glycerol-3-phosphate acyltransferase
LSERDPDYIRRTLTGLWLLASYYFRADVRGLHHVPEGGPVLLVANHSGGNVPADTFVFTLAFSAYFGADRPFYQLAHNLVMVWPGLGFLRRYGTIAATHENAARALDAGAAVLVYPGGDYETHRPSWESARVDFDRRHGFISLALPWGVNVGDLLGHVPLPAKITVQVLPPIDLREQLGLRPDPDDAYDHVVGVMQRALDALAAERRLPIIG